MGGETRPEEAVVLVAKMLIAGYCTVLATMYFMSNAGTRRR